MKYIFKNCKLTQKIKKKFTISINLTYQIFHKNINENDLYYNIV